MTIQRRSFLVAAGAFMCGCDTANTWRGFAYFTAGDPSASPLLAAPVGPRGLSHWLDKKALAAFAGFYVIGVHWPGLNNGDEDYGARYANIVRWLDFMKVDKPMLYAQSRGGLQLLNFACDNPDRIDRIAALYPVTDPYVYPGNNSKLWSAHATTRESFDRGRFTPNLRAAALRGKRIKIWHGDSDKLVPKSATTDVFASASGAEVVTLAGVGHVKLWRQDIHDFLSASLSPSA
jgi:pimeloyl-ACP methyl ester carboxylesterase